MEVPIKPAIIIGLLSCLAFGIGFLSGYNSRSADLPWALLQTLTKGADPTLSARLMDEIQPKNIRENLREITKRPRVAGTPADRAQADQLVTLWESAGFDRAALYPYDVLLSYPSKDNPNKIQILDSDGNALYTTQIQEKILSPEQNRSDIVNPFSAYSAPGTPSGDLVYVNYAREEDFTLLLELGIDPSGRICITRNGKVFRGDKARWAEAYNCSGLIMYVDEQYSGEDLYPDSTYLPGTGVPRGGLFSWGDPLTPGYPATDAAYRIPVEEAGLPTIPVHPIGYDDASVLLGNMTGPEASPEWRGSLPITYRLGPGFVNPAWKTKMTISTSNKRQKTYNAVGFIQGAVEPDRYVILGNHRDTWVLGAIDPSGGTAAMMELSRAFGTLLREGWRPRRSILFCSWAAEEYGLIGSREWVEEFGKIIGDRAVAYINVDVAVLGNFTFRGMSLPTLNQFMFDVAKKIPNPNPAEVAQGRTSVFDTWAHNMPETDKDGDPTGLPSVRTPAFGSDYTSFVCLAGVSTMDLRYNYNTDTALNGYSLYHTGYETFHLVDTFYDPGFIYHTVITQFWAEVTLRLAEDYVLPFDVRAYGKFFAEQLQTVERAFKETLDATGMEYTLTYLQEAVAQFQAEANTFTDRAREASLSNPIAVRMLNDKMMYLDRMFIDPNGVPNFPLNSFLNTNSVMFGLTRNYKSVVLPGLMDSLSDLLAAPPGQQAEMAEQVKRHLAIATHWIQVAASSLADDTEW